MSFEIRLEQESDYRTVEELTREAFWDVHVPGCDEHLLIHNLRKCSAFIPELDFVALKDNQIVGNIAYSWASIIDESNISHDVISFGPISVLPAFQKKGVGTALIEYSKKAAVDKGYKAIIIYGDPQYYNRFGFKNAKEFHISRSDGKYAVALLALELYDNALDGISGRFFENPIFEIDKEELQTFEKTFPYKEKNVRDSQQRFSIMSKATC